MQPGPILCRMRNRQDYHLHGDSVPTRASQALWSLEKIKKEGPAWIITPLVNLPLGLLQFLEFICRRSIFSSKLVKKSKLQFKNCRETEEKRILFITF